MRHAITAAIAVATLGVAALAGAAAAQTAPATTGPYLWAQQEPDHVVLLATGTRHQTSLGWAATVITAFDDPEMGPVRVHAVVEANCETRVRRTSDLHLFPAPDPDAPDERLGVIPGLDWSPPGPKDGPIMDFLCERRMDSARLRPKVSQQLRIWRETR